ncbi:MAG: acyltransferase family protein [Actinobacteria bacterium]|nr:acyltransferase family protein [Actinomycetota bacterium]
MLPPMRRMRYLEAGDAIRGWGVLLVVIGHSGTTALLYSLLNGDPAELLRRQQTQDLGFERLFDSRQAGAAILATQLVVFLFFALSAYLLARPFIAAMFGEAKQAPKLRTYARHRLGRVVPLFWTVILITIVLFGTDGSRTIDIAAVFLFSQTWTAAPFNQNILQAWTMNVEMAFYIALPIIAAASAWIYLRGGRFAGWYALLPMTALAVFAWIFANTWLPTTTVPSQSVIGGLLTFIPGILIAVADVRWGDRLGRWRPAPLAAAGLVVFGVLLAFKQSSLAEGGSVGERNIITIAAGAMLAGFVLWQLTGRKTWPFMMWRFPRWVGERSFSIYLMHGIALFQLQSVGSDQDTVGKQFLVLVLAAIPVSIFYGAILYALVEQPSTRLARGERPLFGGGPVRRIGSRAPTVGTTPTPAMAGAVPLAPTGSAPPAPGAPPAPDVPDGDGRAGGAGSVGAQGTDGAAGGVAGGIAGADAPGDRTPAGTDR